MSDQVVKLTEHERDQIEAEETTIRQAAIAQAALDGDLWQDGNGEFVVVNDAQDAEEFAKLSGFESLAAWGNLFDYTDSPDGVWRDQDGDEIDLEACALEVMESEWVQCDFIDYCNEQLETQVLYNKHGEAVQASLLIMMNGPHLESEGDYLVYTYGHNTSRRYVSGLHDALLENEPDLKLAKSEW
jgi:hypothetical protein